MKTLRGRLMAWGPDAVGSTRALGLMRISIAALAWATWAAHLRLFDHPTWGHGALGLVFFISSTLMLLGCFSRSAAALTALTGLYCFYIDGVIPNKSGMMHHHQFLLCSTLVLLALAPCGRSFSVDRARAIRKAVRAGTVPSPESGSLWAQRLISLQVAAVYLWGVQSKVTAPFLSGERLQHAWMYFYSGADLPTHPAFVPLCQIVAILTLVLEVALGLGLFVRRLQPWLIPAGILFHAALYWLLHVEAFSLIMIALYLSFLPPQLVHRACARMIGEVEPVH